MLTAIAMRQGSHFVAHLDSVPSLPASWLVLMLFRALCNETHAGHACIRVPLNVLLGGRQRAGMSCYLAYKWTGAECMKQKEL